MDPFSAHGDGVRQFELGLEGLRQEMPPDAAILVLESLVDRLSDLLTQIDERYGVEQLQRLLPGLFPDSICSAASDHYVDPSSYLRGIASNAVDAWCRMLEFEIRRLRKKIEPEADGVLVTLNDVAEFVHLEPSSLTDRRKDWPKPEIEKLGRRSAKWRKSALLPILQKQFPDLPWADF